MPVVLYKSLCDGGVHAPPYSTKRDLQQQVPQVPSPFRSNPYRKFTQQPAGVSHLVQTNSLPITHYVVPTEPKKHAFRRQRKTQIEEDNEKEERDLMQEIATAPPGIYIDESDSDDESTDSSYTSINSHTPSSDSNDCSFIDTISDGKSLPSQSFAGYMMILKGYTLFRRTFKALPRNRETTQSRKMQHRFSQAYKPTNVSTPNKTHAPANSVDHNPLSKAMARLSVTNSDPLSPSSRLTERKVHIPDEDNDNARRGRTSPKAPSASWGKCQSNDERSMDDAEKFNCVRKSSCLPQTTNGSASSEALAVSPNLTSLSHPPAVDPTRFLSLPMDHPGSSENIAFGSALEFAPLKSEEIFVPLSSNPVPQLPFQTPQQVPLSATNFLANSNIPSLTSRLPGPAIDSLPFALQNFLGHVPLAEQSTFSSLEPFLSSTMYNGYTADPATFPRTFHGPSTSEPLVISPDAMDTTFPTEYVMHADEDKARWIRYSGYMDADMAYVEATVEQEQTLRPVDEHLVGQSTASAPYEQYFTNPSVGLDTFRFDIASVPVTSTTQYLGVYEPTTISAFGAIPTAVPTLVPSSNGSFAIGGPTRPTFDPTAHHLSAHLDLSAIHQSTFGPTTHFLSADVDPSAIESVFVSASQDSSSTFAYPLPAPEQPTEFFGSSSMNPCSGPSEVPQAEQHAYESNAPEQAIQQSVSNFHTTLENEGSTQNASSSLAIEVHGPTEPRPSHVPNTMVQQETVARLVSHNDVTAPVLRMPQYTAPSAKDLTGEAPAADDDETKTEPDDCINENEVNAAILAEALFNIPLTPSVVANIQVLEQRKRKNSNCTEGISHMRAKQRQMDAQLNHATAPLGKQRARLNNSRSSPYGSVTRRHKGNAKRYERWDDDPLRGIPSEASAQSSIHFRTSGVKSGNNAQSRSPLNPSIINRDPTPPQPDEGHSTIPTSSLRRLRDDDPNAVHSEERPERGGPVKRARFRGSVEEETSDPAEPPAPSAQPTPDKRPPFLRRAFGFGSAGRGGCHPTDNSVHKRPDATAASRRTRSSGISASKHDLANARRKFLAIHQAKGRFKNLSVT